MRSESLADVSPLEDLERRARLHDGDVSDVLDGEDHAIRGQRMIL
jgi:hypothetical protein